MSEFRIEFRSYNVGSGGQLGSIGTGAAHNFPVLGEVPPNGETRPVAELPGESFVADVRERNDWNVAKPVSRSVRRIARIAASALACGGLTLSGCTYRPIADPKYRFDSAMLLDRGIVLGRANEQVADIVRGEIERLIGVDRSLSAYERTMTALGATCRREAQSLRCGYIKQVRYTALLLPPVADQYEYEIRVIPSREGAGQVAVCFGDGFTSSSTNDLSGLPDYFRPHRWRCSPPTAIADECKAAASKRGMDRFMTDCGP